MYKALIADIAELQEGYARRREAAEATAKPPAPMTKARPPVRPIARRPAPPVAKPAPRRSAPPVAKVAPADWLAQIKAEQRKTETSLMQSRLRAASAQVARGEVSAIEAAKLDIANHRAAALGIWR